MSVHPPQEIDSPPIDIDMLDHLHDMLEGIRTQIHYADRKAQAIFSVNALMIAALSLVSQNSLNANQPINDIIPALRGIAVVLLLATIAASSYYVLLTLTPRLKTGMLDSLYFFGRVAQMPHDQYVRAYIESSLEERARQILDQVHVNSQIAVAKYRNAARATDILYMTLIILAVIVALSFF